MHKIFLYLSRILTKKEDIKRAEIPLSAVLFCQINPFRNLVNNDSPSNQGSELTNGRCEPSQEEWQAL